MTKRRRATLSALSVLLAEPESTTSHGYVGSLQLAEPGCSIVVAAHVAQPLHSPGGKSTIAKGRRAPMEQLMGAIQQLFLETLQQHTQTHNDTPTYAYTQ